MYKLIISSRYKKDLKLAKKQGRDMDRFFLAVDMLGILKNVKKI